MKRILCAVRATVFLILSAASASAQFETASIVGTVRDNSGAVIGEATVTLTNVATGVSQTKISDASGIFEFSTLRIGTYLVTAEKAGFAVAVADGIELTVGARQRVDLTMQVGQLTERVEVLAAATRLETDTSQRGQVITGDQTRALPLNGRDYSALALLTTGVRQSAIGTGGFTPREGSFNINGLRSTVNNFLIDGVDNNAYGTSNQGFSNQVMQPAPDAVAEFKVVTNNMSAEYGRAAGGVINVAYRSGTNAFHGSGFEFYRDTKFNATGFFKPPAGGKPPLERNQFGGVVGGPIIRNKAFFFADYEGFRQTRALVTTSTIPTVAQRQGVLTVAVTNPLTGSSIPAGSPIPMTTFARRVLEGLPEPTSAGTANNYAILQEFTNDTDKMGGKVDYQVSPRLSFFGRAGYRDVDITDQPPIPLPSGGDGNGFTYVTNKQVAFGSTWSPTNNSLFEFRFAWSDTTAGKNPPALGSGSAADLFGITGLPTDDRVSPAVCRRSSSPVTRISAARRRTRSGSSRWSSIRRSTTSWTRGPALDEDRLRVPAHSDGSAGRQPAVRTRSVRRTDHAAGRCGGQQSLQPRRLHARPAQHLRTQQHPGRQSSSEHALRVRAGRFALQRQADAESRPALRVRDAALGEGQRAVQLRRGAAGDGPGHGTDRSRIAPRSSRTATTLVRASASPTR